MAFTRDEVHRRSAARRRELEEQAEALTAELAALGATEVWVFGSFARGDVGPESDLDVIAVMPTDLPPHERLLHVYGRLRRRHGADVLVYTPQEFARLRETRPFVRRAVAEGRRLYLAP